MSDLRTDAGQAHLSLETCKRLKQLGFPQTGRGLDRAYVLYGQATDHQNWRLEQITLHPADDLSAFGGGYLACPPAITADGKGGYLSWLESKGFKWQNVMYHTFDEDYEEGWWATNGAYFSGRCDSPEALLLACLDHMEVPA